MSEIFDNPRGLARIRHEFFPQPDPFDLRLGVKTSGMSSLWIKRYLLGNRLRYNRYYPVDEETFKDAVSTLPRWHFVDVGCGKGRALILAHEAGFTQLSGVDFSRRFCRQAEANLNKLGITAAISCGDATEYDFPNEPAVIFLFNPFGPDIMSKVIARLGNYPRQIVYINPRCEELFSHFRLVRTHSHFRIYANQ